MVKWKWTFVLIKINIKNYILIRAKTGNFTLLWELKWKWAMFSGITNTGLKTENKNKNSTYRFRFCFVVVEQLLLWNKLELFELLYSSVSMIRKQKHFEHHFPQTWTSHQLDMSDSPNVPEQVYMHTWKSLKMFEITVAQPILSLRMKILSVEFVEFRWVLSKEQIRLPILNNFNHLTVTP